LEGISKNANRLDKLANNILEVTRIDSNILILNKQRATINILFVCDIGDELILLTLAVSAATSIDYLFHCYLLSLKIILDPSISLCNE
jgi:hypothetical protein